MKSFFEKDGTLKPVCQLSNIVSYNGDEIKICVPEEIAQFIYFRFQNKKFKLRDITDSLIDATENEIFPGIYLRNVECKNWFIRLIYKLLQKKQYLMRNENKRDYFQVCSELEEPKPESRGSSESSTSMEDIDPHDVEQPGNLGSGKCEGCPVYSYFDRLSLLGEYGVDGYYFFWAEDAVEATRKEDFFLEKCRKSSCFGTYEKILKEGYSKELEERDSIKIDYKNGKYIATEGKHRICAMRRFGYSQLIPMQVTRSSEGLGDKRGIDKQYYSNNKYVLESCYGIYERLGISSDDVRELLKDPDATVLDYLDKSKYSYEELPDHFKETKRSSRH